jgi:predicted ATP-grasp superfamily ATP-dependent carboligase
MILGDAMDGRAPGKAPALVLGTEHPRSAAVVRSLARAGIPVDVADHCRPPTALWRGSWVIRHRYQLSEDVDEAVTSLVRLGGQGGGMLIPTNDHYLMLASQHHATLSRAFTVTVPPWAVLGPMMDKVTARALAEAVGLEAPRQWLPRDAHELSAVLASLDFANQAYVLKIRLWDRGAADPLTRRRVAPAGADAATAEARCVAIYAETGAYPIIEAVVPGGADRCIGVSMVVDQNHEPVIAYCVRRLKLQLYARGTFKHPYELGANACCESVYDPEAIALATRFVRQACFTGAITVELKRDPRDERLKFIKADCRFVRAARLSTALGLDAPTALHAVFSRGRLAGAPPAGYRAGVKWLWLEAYVYALWKNRREIGLGRELLRLLRLLPAVRAWAYFDWRDPLPTIMLAISARRRLTLLETPETRGGPSGRWERAASG